VAPEPFVAEDFFETQFEEAVEDRPEILDDVLGPIAIDFGGEAPVNVPARLQSHPEMKAARPGHLCCSPISRSAPTTLRIHKAASFASFGIWGFCPAFQVSSDSCSRDRAIRSRTAERHQQKNKSAIFCLWKFRIPRAQENPTGKTAQ